MDSDICQVVCIDEVKVASAREAMPSERDLERVALIFRALGELSRVRILSALLAEELCVCDLATLLKLSSSAVSHQLRLLRTAGLVHYRRAGKIAYYRLDDDHVRRLLTESLRHAKEG